MWERQVPVGELYALGAFKQLRGRWVWSSRGYGAALAAFGVVAIALGGVASGVILIVFGAFLAVWPEYAIRRARSATMRRAGGDTATMLITEDDVTIRSANWSNTIRWRAVTRITEHDERWLVYLTKRNAVPVPKSVFTEAERAEVRDFLATRTTGRPEPTPA
jgi:hypothetical protein